MPGQQGRIDLAVSNAGIIRDRRVENLTDDDWHQVLAVNLAGVLHLSRGVLKAMKDRGYGRPLAMLSMSSRGNFGQSNDAAAKAGVVGLARTLATEGAAHGITSNVIAPGLIDTPMLASIDDRGREKLAGRIHVGHIGDPTDSPKRPPTCVLPPRYATRVILDVDGGISLGASPR